MSTASIFYRFRSQKDPSRVTFDGLTHTVFELKKDIITQNKLGEGNDFELRLYTEEGEEYDDDTTPISRSSSVIARRSPARIPGKGSASRYVSGRMPVNAKKTAGKLDAALNIASASGGGADEADNLSSMFKMQQATINAGLDGLTASTMPMRRPQNKADVPDKPPPPGYVCYRCGEKGHWIQACPTNDDPTYVSQPRFKRTTGIPRSMLVKVNKEDFEDGEERPEGIMLSAEGDWVVTKSDYEEFQKYQAKVRQSKLAQVEETQGSKELQERGLECPLDRRLFVDPAKTPCCGKTYCGGCINNALTDNDLHCPNCKSEILFDDLTPDEDKRAAVRAYEAERSERTKEQAAATAGAQASALAAEVQMETIEPADESATQSNQPPARATDEPEADRSVTPESKKRKADTQLESTRAGSGPPPAAPKGPAAQTQQQQQDAMAGFMQNGQNMMWQMPGMPGMPGMNGQWPMGMPMMPGMEAMPGMGNMQWPQQGQGMGQGQQGMGVGNVNGGFGQGGRGGQQGGARGRRGGRR